MVSLDVEIIPRLYIGKKKERSCNKKWQALYRPQNERKYLIFITNNRQQCLTRLRVVLAETFSIYPVGI